MYCVIFPVYKRLFTLSRKRLHLHPSEVGGGGEGRKGRRMGEEEGEGSERMRKVEEERMRK